MFENLKVEYFEVGKPDDPFIRAKIEILERFKLVNGRLPVSGESLYCYVEKLDSFLKSGLRSPFVSESLLIKWKEMKK